MKNCASICHAGATSNLESNTCIFGNCSKTNSLVCVIVKSTDNALRKKIRPSASDIDAKNLWEF